MGALELGQAIREARDEAQLSIRVAALSAGCATSHYVRLERGEVARPSPEVLRRVAGATGASYERLLGAAGYL